jgi:hypothetical protein
MVMGNNIVQAKVSIKGIRPLFFHKFGREAIPLEKQEKTGVAGNDPVEWRKTVMVTKDGQLYLESTYAFATVVAGSAFVKKGRGSIQNNVRATLQIMDSRILVDRWFPGFPNGHAFDVKIVETPPEDAEAPVYLDVRGVRNPQTKAANVRYRIVASPGWSCTFTIKFDKTVVSRGEMESAIVNAGTLVGIGNGRKIGMGRFDVEAFEMQE